MLPFWTSNLLLKSGSILETSLGIYTYNGRINKVFLRLFNVAETVTWSCSDGDSSRWGCVSEAVSLQGDVAHLEEILFLLPIFLSFSQKTHFGMLGNHWKIHFIVHCGNVSYLHPETSVKSVCCPIHLPLHKKKERFRATLLWFPKTLIILIAVRARCWYWHV